MHVFTLFEVCRQNGTGKNTVQVSPKLILLSKWVVGRIENQPPQKYLWYSGGYFTSTQDELFGSFHGLFNSLTPAFYIHAQLSLPHHAESIPWPLCVLSLGKGKKIPS